MSQPQTIRIGTRGSKLALWQAQWVSSELKKRNPGIEMVLVPIKTTGDLPSEQSEREGEAPIRLSRLEGATQAPIIDNEDLSKIGGKGLFLKEIDESLLKDKIDLAVHSVKDIPADLPAGLTLAAIPRREDPRDVLVSSQKVTFHQLPSGSRVGTSSLRRIYQLKKMRDDLDTVMTRGNVDTRIKKMERGEINALVLAAAGLIRLGLSEKITEYLPMVPAVGQGAMGIEIRKSDKRLAGLVAPLNDPDTFFCVGVERDFLKAYGATCTSPLGCHVTVEGDEAVIKIFLCQPDGSHPFEKTHRLPRAEAVAWAKKLAKELQIITPPAPS